MIKMIKKEVPKVNGLRALYYTWFVGSECIGLVICKDEVTKTNKIYIRAVPGENEFVDVQRVMAHGASVPIEELEFIISFFKKTSTIKE